MDNVIKIYKTKWDNISHIRKLFNEFLLKYRVYEVDEKVFTDYKKETPIVEIQEEFFYNPTVTFLKDHLGLRESFRVEYHDNVIIGSSVECTFFLDYALKHNMDSICLGGIDSEHFKNTYEYILKLPNPYIGDYVFDEEVDKFEIYHNRSYIKLKIGNKDLYTRSSFIVFDGNYKLFDVENEFDLINKYIFFEKDELIKAVKEKRVRNKRVRSFAVIGDNPRILWKTLELCDELEKFSDVWNFEILVLSPLNFWGEDKYLMYMLRKRKNIRVVGDVNILSFDQKNFQAVIKSELTENYIDFILSCNKMDLKNNFVKDVFDLNKEGYIETDHSFKSKFPNIYSMRHDDLELNVSNRIRLLDKYIECAQVGQKIKYYLDEN